MASFSILSSVIWSSSLPCPPGGSCPPSTPRPAAAGPPGTSQPAGGFSLTLPGGSFGARSADTMHSMLLLLVRHAVTAATGNRLSGWLPGHHLSEEGVRQAEAVAARLAGLPVKAIYSSPLE